MDIRPILLELCAAFNAHDLDRIMELFADECVLDMPRGPDPWGSRYEADPEYSEDAVRELRTQWLWNSHRGRAAAVLVGRLDDDAAGYVTCLLDEPTGHGEIELVGTLPRFRGRRVAHRLLQHAVSWFSTRATRVTVRTQATNFAAAALYEKAGFTLAFSDLTFRLSLAAR